MGGVWQAVPGIQKDVIVCPSLASGDAGMHEAVGSSWRLMACLLCKAGTPTLPGAHVTSVQEHRPHVSKLGWLGS